MYLISHLNVFLPDDDDDDFEAALKVEMFFMPLQPAIDLSVPSTSVEGSSDAGCSTKGIDSIEVAEKKFETPSAGLIYCRLPADMHSESDLQSMDFPSLPFLPHHWSRSRARRMRNYKPPGRVDSEGGEWKSKSRFGAKQ